MNLGLNFEGSEESYRQSGQRQSRLGIEEGSDFLYRGCAQACRGRHGSRDEDEAKRTRWDNTMKKFEYRKGIWDFAPCVLKSDWRFIKSSGLEGISWFQCVGLLEWRPP